jgi:hypothetical protein
MNTCGIQHFEIYSKFLVEIYEYDKDFVNKSENVIDILNKITPEWYLSEYYNILIENNIKTPYSEFITMEILIENPKLVDDKIKTFKNSQVFARTDSCSSKPSNPFYSADEIINSLKFSDRTNNFINDSKSIVVLREYISNISDYYEFRCFVHDGKLRGISSAQPINCKFKIEKILSNIIKLINNIIFYTEYDMCTIDIAINQFDQDIIIIEINTPVWLCATSGLFDLTNNYDYEVLLGTYKPDIIEYPIIKVEYIND